MYLNARRHLLRDPRSYIYKQTELAYKSRSCRDRESNHGSPAFRADVLTITPPRSYTEKIMTSEFLQYLITATGFVILIRRI